MADKPFLDELFSQYQFSAVIDFAAFSLVGESVTEPAKYYRNNVANTLNLLDAMVQHKVLNLVFSSTAATYGNPVYTPFDEQHPQNPINPYGASKWMVERFLQDYAVAYGLNSVALRYFNACGADPELELGEMHDPETHLIPLVLQAASGRCDSICIFGEDILRKMELVFVTTFMCKTCVKQNEQFLNIDQLSDGYKTLLGLVIDLSARMAMANPDSLNPFVEQSIVMIDEVDLHLHPAWQKRVVSDLLRTFPSTQFILTTHSPYIVESINNSLKLAQVTQKLPEQNLQDRYPQLASLKREHIIGCTTNKSYRF